MKSPIPTRRLAAVAALCTSAAALFSSGVKADIIQPHTILISSSTYNGNTGLVAQLTPGAMNQIPNGNGTGAKTLAGPDYTQVFNNAANDGSFGVTSEITLQNFALSGGPALNTLDVPTAQVVTSFPSKSELALNFAPDGRSVSFIGYGGAGIGNLDVSNSDTPGIIDPTNPVTEFYGNGHVYARTIVTVGAGETFSYTPTNSYPGNNGRAVLLGTNGLYYMVGNSNNGANAAPPETNHTGLSVVTPVDAASAGVAPVTPTQIDSDLQFSFGNPPKADKAGKDNNFRGITEFNNNLYFTKGSGSNGFDTVYTVSDPGGALPTAATADTAVTSVLPGFETTRAGNNPPFTPFGLFFGDSKTLYVADEGSGDPIVDGGSHAGLEKWSLVNGKWQLDYTLRNGLIGTSYTLKNAAGMDPYATVTTVGLRNITGEVINGIVRIWGVTSTSSASGDNGADPNEVVMISDVLSQTVLPLGESFSVFDGPQYGVVYRGVAVNNNPEPASLALVGAVLGGIALMRRRRAKREMI